MLSLDLAAKHRIRPALLTTLALVALALVGCDTPVDLDVTEDPFVDASSAGKQALLEDLTASHGSDRGGLNGTLRSLMARQAPRRGLSFYRLPGSDDLGKIPQDPNNRLTAAKVELGRMLYHETALGVSSRQTAAAESYACASCHFAQAGFQAGIPQGIAEGGVGFGSAGEARVLNPEYDSSSDVKTPDLQPIRTPSTLNSAYQELQLWNGQFGGVGDNLGTEANWTGPKESNNLGLEGLETQAHAGLVVHRMEETHLSRVTKMPEYMALLRRAFPDDPRSTRLNCALAIAAFERTLLANESPFQRWLRGDMRAMSEQEYRGAILFFGKADCVGCHTGPALNSMTFHALGMGDLDDAADPRVHLEAFGGTVPDDVRRGRGGFTGLSVDDYKFKTPQLYNLKDSPHYGHGSTFSTIREIVEYKNAGVSENPRVPPSQLSESLRPLGLTETEVDDLVAFLEDALYDPYLMRYVPLSLPSGNCTPVNDAQARTDLGCETIAGL
jgi:cytochrome c peroxidase